MKQHQFTTHDGIELVATLTGEPGQRRVAFTRSGADYGTYTLQHILTNGVNLLAPLGQVQTCSEEELVVIDINRAMELAEWIQGAAMGREEGIAA